MTTISLNQFRKIAESGDSSKPFTELFILTCNKCKSNNIELFGNKEIEYGYGF